MTTERKAWLLALGTLLAALCSLTGCESWGHFSLFNYTTEPPFDTSIKTIYLPIAKNYSYRKGLEFELTQAVVREIVANSPYRLVSDCSRADTELDLKIVNRRKNTIVINPLGEIRDAELQMFVEVVWRDLRPGKVGDILSNPKKFDPNRQLLPGEVLPAAPAAVPILITPTANYQPEVGGSTMSAERQLVDRAAVQIVHMMEVWR